MVLNESIREKQSLKITNDSIYPDDTRKTMDI